MEAKIKVLTNLMSGTIASLQQIGDNVRASPSKSLNYHYDKDILDLKASFIRYKGQLESVMIEDPTLVNYDQFTELVNEYYLITHQLASFPTTIQDQKPVIIPQQNINVNLPKLNLTKFSGKIEEYSNFKQIFDSLIHNDPNLSEVQKFYYLKSCLTDIAADLIGTLQVSKENYKIAYDLLENRYSCPRKCANYYINKILDFEPVEEPSFDSYQRFLNTHTTAIQALRQLKGIDLLDYILFSISYRNLDASSRRQFEDKIASSDIQTLQTLMDFVQNKMRACEILDLPKSPTSSHKISLPSSPKPVESYRKKPNSRVEASSPSSSRSNSLQFSKPRVLVTETKPVSPTSNNKCVYCNSDDHFVYRCTDFLLLSIADRNEFIKKARRCFRCFGTHAMRLCRSEKCCQVCNSNKHNTLLHPYSNPEQSGISHVASTPKAVGTQISDSSNVKHTLASHADSVSHKSVLLGTAVVFIKDKYGQNIPLRGVLDSASQSTLITSHAIQKLGFSVEQSDIKLLGLSVHHANVLGAVNLTIISCVNPSWSTTTSALVLNRITSPLPSEPLNPELANKFKMFKLADQNFDQPAQIDLLLGADIFCEILMPNAFTVSGQPTALATELGVIVIGKLPSQISVENSIAHTHFSVHSLIITNDKVSKSLQKFWEAEEVSAPKFDNPDDVVCEKIFQATTNRDSDGRYVVALPFKKQITLQSTRKAAQRALLRLEKRLNDNPELKLQYHNFMQEYISLGHMLPTANASDYIIPHHVVLKESSSTTKVRTVFNASYADSNGNSLNSCLLSGPKLQLDLCNILIAFRLYKYAITTDLKMMYRMIRVRDEDCIHQHIFYRSNVDQPIQEYELKTVTYGLAPSAYLAQRTLIQLAEDEGKDFPLASQAILQHSYIDDIILSVPDLQSANRLIQELIQLFKLGSFELRKWASSHPSLLSQFPDSHLENPLLFSDDSQSIKVLGLQWTPSTDSFSYLITSFDDIPTKRNILSYLARIFDPLGFLTPLTFKIKCFLKELWQQGTDWDSPLPANLIVSWNKFSAQFSSLASIVIPRCLFSDNASLRLVGFCDASELGYAASIYLVVSTPSAIRVHLIKAKSRVAPNKHETIPRLELCAAVLLSRLYESVLSSFQTVDLEPPRLFSDAVTVLRWINTPPHLMKIYVANRVNKVLEYTSTSMWYHVSTHENPADIASRGSSPDGLIVSNLWWHGPSFLHAPIEQWPQAFTVSSSEDLPELRTERSVLVSVEKEPPIDFFDRFSSYGRMIRIICYILRFVNRTRKKCSPYDSIVISVPEIEDSIKFCVKLTQATFFTDDLKLLNDKKPVSRALAPLTPFIDESGLIRVGGRLLLANVSRNQRHPWLLPKKCQLSSLICDYYHQLSAHSGPRGTQALIQQKFWILSIRSLLRKRIHRCFRCIRFNAKPSQPLMASLPKVRVNPSRPFTAVGIDYAGPFNVKEANLRVSKVSKGYLAVFVCMTVKAVHLEFVSDLSTEAFLAAFDRFVARRGYPAQVFSDNGSNFVGAANQLKDVFLMLKASSTQIIEHLAKSEVQWNFNPPAAPNFGGLWESAVKSAKSLLRRTIGDRVLTFEEYITIFSRIEAILNSRPLLENSTDPSELCDMLTPGHFLIGSPLLSPPEMSETRHSSLRNRWALLRHIAQVFWNTWSKQYLQLLLPRRKWNKSSEPPKLGQLVILIDSDIGPARWPLGKITHLFPGKDSTCRVATVFTTHGTYNRPVNKLILLPVFSKL